MDEVPVVLTEEFDSVIEPNSSPIADSNASTLPASLLADISSADPDKRVAALHSLARNPTNETFSVIARCFDDPVPQVRNTAARALRDSAPERTVESFTMAIEEGSVDRVRNIGVAIAESGLAAEALQDLRTQSREDTYKALSLLFVMAKAGEIQPLLQAIEEHPESEICSAAVKLLNLSGQTNSAEAALQRRLEKLTTRGEGSTPFSICFLQARPIARYAFSSPAYFCTSFFCP
jgi:HEAT repeat protein